MEWSYFLYIYQLGNAQGVDSSYHVRINMSVRRGIIGGITIHIIHKEEVKFLSSVYIEAIEYFEAKVDVQKGAPNV